MFRVLLHGFADSNKKMWKHLMNFKIYRVSKCKNANKLRGKLSDQNKVRSKNQVCLREKGGYINKSVNCLGAMFFKEQALPFV